MKTVTRGFGLLEGLLALQRCRVADRLIPPELRKGKILDIGCGKYPFFLNHINFNEKFGIDKSLALCGKNAESTDITLINYDFISTERLPFEDTTFDVVSMLAVIEHIELEKMERLTREICRILKDGGILIITTPAFWTGKLLKIMAKLRLVSPEEIAEHKTGYHPGVIREILTKAKFSREDIESGFFECCCNFWTKATK